MRALFSRVLISIGFISTIGCPAADCARIHSPHFSYEQIAGAVAHPIGWRKVDAGAFWLFAPVGWEFHQLQGVDSYVGEIVGEGVVLKFDFGAYSNPLKKEKKPQYVVVHEPIGGFRARIVSPQTPGHGITGIYFPRTFGSNKLSLFGQDLTSAQQELVLRIFKTIRFGHTVHPVVVPPPPPRGANVP
jgi:hypothetical protein